MQNPTGQKLHTPTAPGDDTYENAWKKYGDIISIGMDQYKSKDETVKADGLKNIRAGVKGVKDVFGTTGRYSVKYHNLIRLLNKTYPRITFTTEGGEKRKTKKIRKRGKVMKSKKATKSRKIMKRRKM